MQTILTVVGTRPEAIKMAPVIRELRLRSDRARTIVCATGQHREILDQALGLFGIEPDIRLAAMRPGQSLAALTARLLDDLDPVIEATRPDWILAQGDTTTVLAAALAAFYRRARFGHVEAGLRTPDRSRPFPEEMNRRLADRLADVYFAPTARARQALLDEGCPASAVHLTGNTIVDALQTIAATPYAWANGPLAPLPRDRRLVLVTLHRRELHGEPIAAMARAIATIASAHQADAHFVVLAHPNPQVRGPLRDHLDQRPGVSLLEPLDYRSLVELLGHCRLVITDSGGLQEEAPSFGVPLLVVRDETERPEGIAAGVSRLIGTDPATVARAIEQELMTGSTSNAKTNPYGDGQAARRIVEILVGVNAR